MPHVSVHIVTHNSLPFLDALLRSLQAQSFQDYSVLVVDNASHDGTVAYITQEWPTVKIVKNRENVGFAKAHNQAILFTESDFVLVLNPDIVLHELFLARLAGAMAIHPRAGSASGKLLRAIGSPRDLSESTFTSSLDSTGIITDRTRQYRDRGAGETDAHQYGDNALIGPSGAAAFYRRSALHDIAFHHIGHTPEYFDELYHSYKEDIDIALRLRRRGWHAMYIASARAFHFRTLASSGSGFRAQWWDHRARARQSLFYSYRNHLYTLFKHEPLSRTAHMDIPARNPSEKPFWKDLPWIIGWEFGKLGYLLITHPTVVLRAWRDVIVHWRELMERRKQVQEAGSKELT